MNVRWKIEIFRMRASKLARLAVRPAYWSDFRQGVLPGLEHVGVPFRETYDVVVDAGASRGQFASFAKHRWPASRIYCFEPLPDCAASARRIVGDRGEVFEAALSDKVGEQDLLVSGREDSSSLLPVGELANQVANAAEVDRIPVAVRRLDEYVDGLIGSRAALLKIDVQGLELEVLKGAGQSLRSFTDIYCECSFTHLYEGQALGGEIISYLTSMGFDLVGIDNPARGDGRQMLQADLLFRNARRECASTNDRAESIATASRNELGG